LVANTSKEADKKPAPAETKLASEQDQSATKATTAVVAAGAATAAVATTVASSSVKPAVERSTTLPTSGVEDKNERPTIVTSATAPVLPPINLEHNAWADEFEEDFGMEKEMTRTFE